MCHWAASKAWWEDPVGYFRGPDGFCGSRGASQRLEADVLETPLGPPVASWPNSKLGIAKLSLMGVLVTAGDLLWVEGRSVIGACEGREER
jgi:hypothetical protein